jgi:SAM-dependent methyltransferase
MSDYDEIGAGYAQRRRPDPRIAAQVRAALGDVSSVVNIGAGSGSYEPTDIEVVAVEPSATMVTQREPGGARVVQAHAESLPFDDDSFDAAMAVLTTHHWSDWRAGVAEMRRVARSRVLVLTWDPTQSRGFWLHEYVPYLSECDATRFCTMDQLEQSLGRCRVEVVRVPYDCTDGFLAAYWRRPRAYLDPDVRAGMSSFNLQGFDQEVRRGMARLAEDIESGTWSARWGHLLEIDALDLGYRLAVAELA